jgi:hypothetical protein
MANPGPASITTQNTQLVAGTQTFTSNPTTQVGQNMIRLLGSARGVSTASTGDAAVIPMNLVGTYSVSNVIVTNAQLSGVSGSIATAAFGVFTTTAAGGTGIVANAANTTNTSNAVVNQRTVASTAALSTTGTAPFSAATPNLYVNVGTALANGTCDVFVYGYDLT